MNSRRGVGAFLFAAFLIVIIVLQIISMVRSDRLYNALNDLDDIFSGRKVISQSSDADLEKAEEGDWLVWGLKNEPSTVNPIVRRDIYAEWILWRNVCEGLYEYDHDTIELKPVLAKSHKFSDDGLSITIAIRDDVWFSDGTEITADDVVFTYKTIMDPRIDAAHWANYYQVFKDVVKVDRKTVKFLLQEPYFKSLELAGFVSVGVVPKHIYEYTNPLDFNQRRSNPVGSGPYVFERWDVGQQLVLVRNENYWGKKPKLKKIVFKFITNSLAILQSLESGEIDFMRPDPEQFAERLANEEFRNKFKLISYFSPKAAFYFIGWNYDVDLFQDKRVRLAMTHLINREYIMEHLLMGQARYTHGPFYIYGRQYNNDVEAWPYDPARAKELLTEAGWVDSDGDGIRDKDGEKCTYKLMIRSGQPLFERMAKYIKDQMGTAGVDVEIEMFEWSVMLERLHDRKFEAEISGWGGDVESDPYQVWHSSQKVNRGSNHVGFDYPEADKLIIEARKTLDDEKRNKMYHRFHELVYEEQPYTFLYFRPEIRFLHPRFKNIKEYKLELNLHEWYVPKSLQKYN